MAVLRVPKKLSAAAQRAVDTPRPTFTPGALDEQGVADTSAMNRDVAMSLSGILQTYQDIVAGINARRPQIENERQMGVRDTQRSHAGRGTLRSGMNVEDTTRVNTGAMNEHLGLSDQAVRAANAWQRDTDRAIGDYTTGVANAKIGADQRQYEQWLERNPVTVDVNHPDITPPGTVTPSWKKAPNALAIAKRYGPGVTAVKRGPKAGGNYVLKRG